LGLTLDLTYLRAFTLEFLDLKSRFFPGLFKNQMRLNRLLTEVKGSDIRSGFRTGDHKRRHHHIGFLDALLDFIEAYDCKIFGRVWVKAIGVSLRGVSVYTYSAQSICATFHHLLGVRDSTGMVIADSRSLTENREVSFSVMTQKLAIAGDSSPRIVEAPVFGHSENHAGLQVCDLLCSALLTPITAVTYCTGHITSVHVQPDFDILKKRYGPRLRELQHRYRDEVTGRWLGGLTVSDSLGRRSGAELFR
jgi:hypothetical protein